MLHFSFCHRYMFVWLKRTYGVVWIRHCVERSNSQRIFIQDIEVGIILGKKSKNVKSHIKVSRSIIWAVMTTFLFELFCYCVLHKYTSRCFCAHKDGKNKQKSTVDCDLDGVDSASCIVYEDFKSLCDFFITLTRFAQLVPNPGQHIWQHSYLLFDKSAEQLFIWCTVGAEQRC